MDIDLLYDSTTQGWDIFLTPPKLQSSNPLATALNISLFTDRRANNDDVLELNDSKRGWWADTFNQIRNDKIGSRLWLLRRAKMTSQTLASAREYVIEACRWLLDDNVASALDVETEFYNAYTIGILITVTKPTGTETFNFQYVWNDI